jgi:CRISPR-associated endoribonuclease Cas6
MIGNRGELFSMLLRLYPKEEGTVQPGAGNQVQAAFLDIVRQSDRALSEWLHVPNQRRPYTLGLLQGFNHLAPARLEAAIMNRQEVMVTPGQVYWLRITMLDSSIFGTFARYLITHPRDLVVRVGNARFEISRLLCTPEQDTAQPWVGYTSFAELHAARKVQKHYLFEFATPTAFSQGQQAWGKLLKLFPEPALVFESLARQWEAFAPADLRLAATGLTIRDLAAWCEEHVIVSRYTLHTSHLPFSKFGQIGFEGDVTYEVKGNPAASEASWLTPLARFALFGGIGYKTTMGMGQARCINITLPPTEDETPAAALMEVQP